MYSAGGLETCFLLAIPALNMRRSRLMVFKLPSKFKGKDGNRELRLETRMIYTAIHNLAVMNKTNIIVPAILF